MYFMKFFSLLGIAWQQWRGRFDDQTAAAIAYHAMLSLAPSILFLLTAIGKILGVESVKRQIMDSVTRLAGEAAVPTAQFVLDSILQARGGVWATTLGLVVMIYFSSNVFYHLRTALNRVWDVSPCTGISGAVIRRALAFLMVLAFLILFLLVVLVNFMTGILSPTISSFLPEGAMAWNLLQSAFSFVLLALLLAVVFKYVPNVSLTWKDVASGAVLTAVMFTSLNLLIGYFIAKTLLASLYGAAGALIIILLWFYYLARMLLFGAEYTRAYTERFGSRAPNS